MAASNLTVGTSVAVTGSSILSAPVIQYAVKVAGWQPMTETEAMAAVAVVAVILHGVVALVGPIAKALSDRIVKAVQPKEVPDA